MAAHDRSKTYRLRQWIALLGAPVAWVAQMDMSEILTSHACYPQAVPLAISLWPWLAAGLMAINAICFAIALSCAFMARSLWRSSKQQSGRVRFLALMSLISSGMFLIAVVFTSFALFLVSPCQSHS